MDQKYLLYIQLILLLFIFYFGDLGKIMENGILTILLITGLFLSLWAFYNIGIKTYSPFPEPKKGGILAKKGLYKYIRHPMYTGIMITAMTLLLSSPNFTAFIMFAALIYVLDEKASLEEKLLSKKYQEYKSYLSKTKKFIPLIY